MEPQERQPEWPLQTMDFDQSTIQDNINWLENVLRKQMGLTEDVIKDFVMIVYGDLATVATIRPAKKQRCGDEGIDSLKCIWPVFGLFHLRMALINIIYVNHHGGKIAKDFGHLSSMIEKLGLKGFKPDKITNFRAAEDLLLHAFHSNIAAWIIEQYPQLGGKEYTQENRRMHTAKILHNMGEEQVQKEVIDPLFIEMFSHRTRDDRAHDKSAMQRQMFTQASQMVTAVALYQELKKSCRHGRVGRIRMVLRHILPYFAGSKSHRYTKELIAFQMLERSTTPETFEFILDNLLIKAKLGGWIEADCHMEHLVRIQKDLYTSKGGPFQWKNMTEHASLLSSLFYELKVTFSDHITPTKVRGKHCNPSLLNGIDSIAAMLVKSKMMNPDKDIQSKVTDNNLFDIGIEKLGDFDLSVVVEMLYGKSLHGEVSNQHLPSLAAQEDPLIGDLEASDPRDQNSSDQVDTGGGEDEATERIERSGQASRLPMGPPGADVTALLLRGRNRQYAL